MKPFKVATEVPADLQRAYDYFKTGSQRAADTFVVRYEKALRHVLEQPETCRIRPHGWRLRPILRSSYSIFYRETDAFWLIGAILSTIRDPDIIQAQLLIRDLYEPDVSPPQ